MAGRGGGRRRLGVGLGRRGGRGEEREEVDQVGVFAVFLAEHALDLEELLGAAGLERGEARRT